MAQPEVKLRFLIDADPSLLRLTVSRAYHDMAKGDLGLGPPVTTCDGDLKASAPSQRRLMGVGEPYHNLFERLARLRRHYSNPNQS